jgi:hypothetical protein
MERFRSQFGPVALTAERKSHIFKFHPEVRRYQEYFVKTIGDPEITHRSKYDLLVLILYRKISRQNYLAIVIKTNKYNFILTAYITNKIRH